MADRLSRYRDKRQLERTPEPPGAHAEADATRGGRFVVQEHDATSLHWDLRLERDGVLASWAIPRGIPRDPSEDRKAVRTEDHPVEYLEFEGEIPAGQYGAGTMRILDRGSYECEKWRADEVIVRFAGERVRGRYALFATERARGRRGATEAPPRDWMIHRMDPPEDPAWEPLPERLAPMLATAGELPRDEAGWAYEIKWDGVRALVRSEAGRAQVTSRNLNDVTSAYPELARLARQLGAREALLDGEIVALDDQGRPDFERLQRRINVGSEREARERRRSTPVVYMIFDLLHLDGRSLLDAPYSERRAALEELGLAGPAWDVPANRVGGGAEFRRATRERELEGLVAKRLDAPYRPGRRSRAWVKVKNVNEVELAIGGWMPGERGRRHRLGALLVGRRNEDGALEYAGRVGTGFSEAELDRLGARLRELRRERNPFARGRGPRGASWVEPVLTCVVEYREWTRDGLLRAPSYRGLVERPQPAAAVRQLARPPDGDFELEVEGRRLKLSNFDKVLYPSTGFTKGALIEYYARIAPVLLPHLRGRPLTLKRYPDGVDGAHFYEKQCPSHAPDWVATARVAAERAGRTIDFCLAEDLPTLVWLGNLADLELHPSLSLAERIECPTALAFDLDPGAPADAIDCCRVALWVRELFDALGLSSYAKTSGAKGMQVYVPLNGDATYAQTKPFAKAVAELLEKQHPDAVVARMSKRLREGKVLVDWSQNDRHKTTVSVYSLRARERPTVSTPLAWDEVEAALEGGDAAAIAFEWEAVLERVAELGDLFAPVQAEHQELPELNP